MYIDNLIMQPDESNFLPIYNHQTIIDMKMIHNKLHIMVLLEQKGRISDCLTIVMGIRT